MLLHVLANFGGFKHHFSSHIGLGVFALVLTLSFIAPSEKRERPFMASVRALSETPISTLALVAHRTSQQLVMP